MKSYSAVVLALAAAANAVQFTNPGVNPEPGKPFDLTWSGAEGPVTITLKSGGSENLKTVEELASNVDGDSTSVTLDPKKLPSDTYAFEISDGKSDPNYSVQFSFKGEGKGKDEGKDKDEDSDSASAGGSTTAGSSSASKSAETSGASSADSSASRPSKTSSPEDDEDKDVPDSGAARDMSPFAFIFVTAAAMLYFN